MNEIEVREVPEQLVVTEQRNVDQAQLVEWLPGAMSRVVRSAEALGGGLRTSAQPHLQRNGHPDEPVLIVIYEGNPNEGPVPVEVCTPVAHAPAGSTDVPARTVPAHREAYLRLTRNEAAPENIGAAYGALERWIGEQGLEMTGAPREVYWTDYFSAGATDEVCDVAWPIR
ncbi:MAG TPA: GyrI-like domain-containing protein [Terriglobales bacterium]|nr:GyrI-like domain-containing protein [Terriglobales bacterium]